MQLLCGGGTSLRRTDGWRALHEFQICLKLNLSLVVIIVLDIVGEAVVVGPPSINPGTGAIFIDSLDIVLATPSDEVDIRYTLDESVPTAASPGVDGPITIDRTSVVKARCFLKDTPVSPLAAARYEKVVPRKPVHPLVTRNGLDQAIYLGAFDSVPDFKTLRPDSESTSCA